MLKIDEKNKYKFEDEAVISYEKRNFSIRLSSSQTDITVACLSLLFVCFLVLASLGFFKISSYREAPFILEGGSGKKVLIAPTAGIISKILVHVGDHVEKGQRIIIIKTDIELSNGFSSFERKARTLTEKYNSLQEHNKNLVIDHEKTISAMTLQRYSIIRQLNLQNDVTKSLERQIYYEKDRLRRVKILMTSGIESRMNYDQLSEQVSATQEKIDQQKITIEKNIESYIDINTRIIEKNTLFKSEQTNIIKEIKDLEIQITQNEISNGMSIVASQSGTVSSILVEEGSSVINNQVVSTLESQIHGTNLSATLFVRSEEAGKILVGNHVWLRFDSFPYQQYGEIPANVTEINRDPIGANDVRTALDIQGPVNLIRVTINSLSFPKKGSFDKFEPGLTGKAEIVVDRKSAASWLMDPFLKING